MNKGYSWGAAIVRNHDVVKRRIPMPSDSVMYECCYCARVFKRKHVRWVGDGWICRDRCERQNRSAS